MRGLLVGVKVSRDEKGLAKFGELQLVNCRLPDGSTNKGIGQNGDKCGFEVMKLRAIPSVAENLCRVWMGIPLIVSVDVEVQQFGEKSYARATDAEALDGLDRYEWRHEGLLPKQDARTAPPQAAGKVAAATRAA